MASLSWSKRFGNLRIGVGHPWRDGKRRLAGYDAFLEVGLGMSLHKIRNINMIY
jgi:hypothetical protein